MLISCPKCKSVYDIDDSRVSPEGKKFKCAECEHIWIVYPEDAIKEENQNNSDIKPQLVLPDSSSDSKQSEVDEMYNRLSQDTLGLFLASESNDARDEKAKFARKMQVIFSPVVAWGCVISLFVTFSLLVGYYNRYEIVGFFPRLANFYKGIYLDTNYVGTDIIFQNVMVEEKEKQGLKTVEITGSLYNEGDKISKVLPLRALMTDDSGNIIFDERVNVPTRRLEPNTSALFHVVMPNNPKIERRIKLNLEKDD